MHAAIFPIIVSGNTFKRKFILPCIKYVEVAIFYWKLRNASFAILTRFPSDLYKPVIVTK